MNDQEAFEFFQNRANRDAVMAGMTNERAGDILDIAGIPTTEEVEYPAQIIHRTVPEPTVRLVGEYELFNRLDSDVVTLYRYSDGVYAIPAWGMGDEIEDAYEIEGTRHEVLLEILESMSVNGLLLISARYFSDALGFRIDGVLADLQREGKLRYSGSRAGTFIALNV
jgi:hypothetical protein